MSDFEKAEAIVAAVVRELPDSENPASPETVEQLLRPFAPVTDALRRHVKHILRERGGFRRTYDIDHWMEANAAVNAEDEGVARTIEFLLHDTCSCVLPHLCAAIAHAKGPVHPQIRALVADQD